MINKKRILSVVLSSVLTVSALGMMIFANTDQNYSVTLPALQTKVTCSSDTKDGDYSYANNKFQYYDGTTSATFWLDSYNGTSWVYNSYQDYTIAESSSFTKMYYNIKPANNVSVRLRGKNAGMSLYGIDIYGTVNFN